MSTVLVARTTVAQGSHPEVLFNQGLAEMRAGRFESACPKLAESHRLDPLPGVLFTLAECEAAWGKISTAAEHYQSFVESLTALAPARREKFEERRHLALEKIPILALQAPEVIVDVARPSPRDLVVRLNGTIVDPASYGVRRKVDPGAYVLTADAGGARVWERRIQLRPRDQARLDVLAPEGQVAAAAPAPAAPPSAPSPDRSSGRSTWIYLLGGLGAAGLTTGLVAGGMAWSQKGSIDQNCPDHLCNANGRSAVALGKNAALASNIGFGVTLAGAGGALTVGLLWPSSADKGGTGQLRLQPWFFATEQGSAIGMDGRF